MDLSLFVRPGEKLTAALWNKLVTAVRSCYIMPGDGVRIRRTPDGTMLSCSLWAAWDHPFRVRGSGSVTINKGLVDGIEPNINGVPLSGDPKKNKPVPTLNITTPKIGKDGIGWIAVEITVDPIKWKTLTAEVVQVDTLSVQEKLKARHPLAALAQRDDQSVDIFQVEFFNLQHRADGATGVPSRHFFWPV